MTPKLYTRRDTPTPRTTIISSRLMVLRQHEEQMQMLLHRKPQTAARVAQATEEARKLIRVATTEEIGAAIREVEDSFGRYYLHVTQSGKKPVNPADEIFDLLKSLRITAGELEEWTRTVKKTSFPLGTGHAWQPLPNLPEANTIVNRVLADIKPEKAQASAYLAVKITPLTDAEIMEAIALDFFDDLPQSGKIEAWRMIPPPVQKAIRLRIGTDATPDAKWAAVRDYHLETIRLAAAEANAKRQAS
jgi:hypothetical protein